MCEKGFDVFQKNHYKENLSSERFCDIFLRIVDKSFDVKSLNTFHSDLF